MKMWWFEMAYSEGEFSLPSGKKRVEIEDFFPDFFATMLNACTLPSRGFQKNWINQKKMNRIKFIIIRVS